MNEFGNMDEEARDLYAWDKRLAVLGELFRLRGKMSKIQAILVEHRDCPSHIGCDGLLEIQAVIDGGD